MRAIGRAHEAIIRAGWRLSDALVSEATAQGDAYIHSAQSRLGAASVALYRADRLRGLPDEGATLDVAWRECRDAIRAANTALSLAWLANHGGTGTMYSGLMLLDMTARRIRNGR